MIQGKNDYDEGLFMYITYPPTRRQLAGETEQNYQEMIKNGGGCFVENCC